MKQKKTVVIVEDDPGLREQLLLVLKSAHDIECLYAVNSGEEAVRLIPTNPPDVVLMDIQLPGMSGIDCVAVLKKSLPDLEFIMLTVYEDAERIFRALKAGASGYLVKSSAPEKLFEAIRDVHSGGAQFSAHIARRVVQYFHGPAKPAQETEKLSPRESEVIELLASGYIYKEIADKLGIGTETVRTYVKNICAKLRVKNRTEAVAKHFS
ncbi:response regulator transcription factor [Roseimicrobium sp. ORNL1]|uniref:response regulator transcription factor n=1 Tax=Roseimicrobium sp. ORNL1 TaxID=2711231 RepID=UPI0013E116E1|nr:response regulator transcription factor [Roseimicrobium sp. ORNL1]QIF05745.1 response regulator transcription factor [Roseimicrobium sp. ORNL1]